MRVCMYVCDDTDVTMENIKKYSFSCKIQSVADGNEH